MEIIKSKLYLGIDNGLSGGICGINDKKEVVVTSVMPVEKNKKNKNEYSYIILSLLLHRLKRDYDLYVAVEQAHPRAISGKRQCFSTGYGYGLVCGVLSGLDINFSIVTPQKWQKEILGEFKRGESKIASANFCLKNYPLVNLKIGKSKKLHTGLTDALCLAEWKRCN
jgi:hypothetical protein